jgi:AraC-like DNA-binding protein
MSRARFAVRFKNIVGKTPGQYLAEWRLGLAQSLLRRGKPIKLIADEVGYSSASALSRAFTALRGVSPSQWLRNTTAS